MDEPHANTLATVAAGRTMRLFDTAGALGGFRAGLLARRPLRMGRAGIEPAPR